MDSEDEMQKALNEAAGNGVLTGWPGSESTGISELEERSEPTTLTQDIYQMLATMMNRLEFMGENLVTYSDPDTGATELSGERYTIKYDPESDAWCVVPGRSPME